MERRSSLDLERGGLAGRGCEDVGSERTVHAAELAHGDAENYRVQLDRHERQFAPRRAQMLDGRCALITGSTQALGDAMAERPAAES